MLPIPGQLRAYFGLTRWIEIGLTTCAQFSSPLVLGPWSGVMTDRFGGRRVLLVTQAMAGLVAMTLGAPAGSSRHWGLAA